MKKLLLILLLGALGAALYFYQFQEPTQRKLEELRSNRLPKQQEQERGLPGPLRLRDILQPSHLTVEGIVDYTNRERVKAGLAPLTVNAQLTEAAKNKIEDMFEDQYFEHVSPDGVGIEGLVRPTGYKFIIIGENLALGNYRDDKDLVKAWMESPGHRENILKNKYTEIGVAVKRGTFDGKRTWLAVQEFGTPLAACPKVDLSASEKINANKKQIEMLKAEADAKRQALHSGRYRDETDNYNQKVAEYNELVRRINALLAETEPLVNQYNAQVRAFNECVGN